MTTLSAKRTAQEAEQYRIDHLEDLRSDILNLIEEIDDAISELRADYESGSFTGPDHDHMLDLQKVREHLVWAEDRINRVL